MSFFNENRNNSWVDSRNSRLRLWRNYEDSLFPIKLVAIETKGQCTRRCSFCPISKSPPRNGEMNIDIIKSLFRQLSVLGYEGQLRLHYYNEPLLDTRIIEVIHSLRKYLPYNFFRLTTNGDLLDIGKLYDLIDAGVSQIKVSIYSPKAHDRIKKLVASTDKVLRKKIWLGPFYNEQNIIKQGGIINRGGTISQEDVKNITCPIKNGAKSSGCDRLEFNIDYLGNVFPCCHSFDGSYRLGNINDNNLLEIYNYSKHRFREHFIGNFTMETCRKCVGYIDSQK